jgi:hypothetical protein
MLNITNYQIISERIYSEFEEYLLHTPNWFQREVFFAVLFASNISTVSLILKRLQSYNGVNKVESFIRTNVLYPLDWLKSEMIK